MLKTSQLLPQGKSVKYMKTSERLEARQLANNDVTADLKYDVINGEWETEHNYMCSACGALYDELREVMHHKWEAHPYALVAHISLREEQQVLLHSFSLIRVSSYKGH